MRLELGYFNASSRLLSVGTNRMALVERTSVRKSPSVSLSTIRKRPSALPVSGRMDEPISRSRFDEAQSCVIKQTLDTRPRWPGRFRLGLIFDVVDLAQYRSPPKREA